jgi:branched-chain amino acid transport system ATP-binding protein
MSETKTPVLEIKDLGIDFGGLTAVNDLNMKSIQVRSMV